MTKTKPKSKRSAALDKTFNPHQLPAGIVPILKQCALVWGETAADYNALLHEIEPTTTVQWLHVKHLTDHARR